VILRDNITKVKDDPKFIAKAQTISNSVNQIINIQLLKLDMHKTFKGKNIANAND